MLDYEKINKITQEKLNFLNNDKDSPYELWEQTANNLKEQTKIIKQLQYNSDKESKINKNRFVIQTILSITALISAVVAAVAAIIALL